MPPGIQPHTLLTFVVQLALLLTAARSLGEIARRLGQPPVIGELTAGVLLGPSVLGMLAPDLQLALFPRDPLQFQILEVIAWLGMIWLLLMTGLETDLDVLRNLGRAAFYASVLGMVIPFVTAFALGWVVPDRLLVRPDHRLIFALFLATALSISAIPVIARILTDLDLMRRNIGVVILGAGVTDDTTGWLLLSIIAGIATRGEISLGSVALAVASTAAFVAFVYVAGARAVSALLQWIDDRVEVRHAMMTAVFVIALVFGAITESIGIHAVFGAFVAGLVIGRSPRLRKTTLEQIEGPLLAVFAPIFFAYAGLKVDLAHGFEVGTTLAVLAVACAGKLVGASAGAYWGGLGLWESLAIGSGMNARGAMELVIALIGLSLGILTAPMYAAIVIVAIFTSAIAGSALALDDAPHPGRARRGGTLPPSGRARAGAPADRRAQGAAADERRPERRARDGADRAAGRRRPGGERRGLSRRAQAPSALRQGAAPRACWCRTSTSSTVSRATPAPPPSRARPTAATPPPR